jgi:hypothetical protein
VGLVVLAHNLLTLLSEEKKVAAAKAAVVNPTGSVPKSWTISEWG